MAECYYCGCAVDFIHPDGNRYKRHKQYGVLDHIYPSCLGGDKVPKEINLVLACDSCNEKKNGKHPLKWYLENGGFGWNKAKKKEYLYRIKVAVLIVGGFQEYPEWVALDNHIPKFVKEIKLRQRKENHETNI